MNTDIIYQKYEQYSIQYIISLEQIESFCLQISDNNLIDELIKKQCYYNIVSKLIDDFELKLKHNIKLAQDKNDNKFLSYLQNKFAIIDDLKTIDVANWNYKSNTVKLKLKLKPNINKGHSYKVQHILSDLIETNKDHIFKYKSDIIRLVHKHIYENRLQDVINPCNITPDKYLNNLLSPLSNNDKSYTFLNLPHYLNHQIFQI